MIKYDVTIIGGGIAGYSAGIRCLEAGLKTMLISQGQSALHFSSGSLDVLGKLPNGDAVLFPFDALKELKNQNPKHPYSKIGKDCIQRGLNWFQDTLNKNGLPLIHQKDESNHFRITPMGTLKATWLSQPFVYQHKNTVPFKRIVSLAIEGYRDFQPHMLQDNLRYLPEFSNIPMQSIQIQIPAFGLLRQNPNELNSIDIANILKEPKVWTSFCDQLMRFARHDDLIILPAIVGSDDGLGLLNQLKKSTQFNFHEIPTMPPSLMGIRIEETLKRTFLKMGGMYLRGDKVIAGEFKDARLLSVNTQNMCDMPVYSDHFVMATGSYFSQGLEASHNSICEPIFNLEVMGMSDRIRWRNASFFSSLKSHPFMTFGVKTNETLNPTYRGKMISNLYCCGSMLSDYDPVFEGCGGGVAIATAYCACEQIITQMQKTSLPLEVGV